MSLEINENKEKELLFYRIKNNEFNFFYKNILIFQNNKNKAFISLRVKEDGIIKEINLYNCQILKEKENYYNIDFYNKNYRIKSNLYFEKGKVYFNIKNQYNYEINLFFINENNEKIDGFGCNNIESFENKKISKFNKDILNINDVIIDKKLGFLIKNKFLAFADKIDNWDIYVKNGVNIKIKQQDIKFVLLIDNIDEYFKISTNKPKYKLLYKDNFSDTENFIQSDGMIYFGEKFDKSSFFKVGTFYERYKKKFIYRISPFFKQNSDLDKILNLDEKQEIEKIDNISIFAPIIKTEETERKLKNEIRKYYDANISGLFLDENIDKEDNVYFKDKYSEKYKNIIISVSKEYDKKMFFYNKFEDYKINGIYVLNEKINIENKEKFLFSVLCSGISTYIFYEKNKEFYL